MNTHELAKLRIDFAFHKMQTGGVPIQHALRKYAGIYKILKGVPQDIADNALALIEPTDSSNDIVDLLFRTRREFREGDSPERRECFYYGIRREVQAYLHFNNSICPKHPMRGEEFKNRKAELTDIARDIRNNQRGIKILRSGSWIWSLRAFQSLMPVEFVASLSEVSYPETYSYAQFGQFIRYDGTINTERAEQFRATWQFPIKTLEGECDIADFIKLYHPMV